MYVEWWITSYSPPNCGYSFPSWWKQCGQAVTTVRTPYLASVSTLSFASIW